MNNNPAELIKEKIDVVDFLRGYLSLQPAGKNFKARCPFHKEKTPSFMVSPDRQSWHCFGCSLGGDIFSFIMQYENIEFGEALRVLAEKAGVELKRLNPSEYKFTGALYEINTQAKDFFKRELEKHETAKKYLRERGLTNETIAHFELGWAPQSLETLILHLIKLGCSQESVISAGLAIRTDRGLVIDRFRGRIMFPIHNHFGKVGGFTGRILPEALNAPDIAKYMNTPETPIFQKSKLLYGLWSAKNEIRDRKSAFLVEGQMDCIMSFQSGVKNVIASSGTALTSDHLKTLRRIADEIIFSFDNDEAGKAAGERAIDLASSEDFHVKVVTFKDYKDPADVAVANPALLVSAIKDAKPATLFYFERYLDGVSDFTARDGLGRLRAVLKKIMSIQSPVLKDYWLRELSKQTAINESVLREEGEKISDPSATEVTLFKAVPAPQRVRSRIELLSERLLGHAVAENGFDIVLGCEQFLPPLYTKALEHLKSSKKTSGDPELDSALNSLFLHSERLNIEEINFIKQEIRKEHVKRRRIELVHAVKRAELTGNQSDLKNALDDLKELASEEGNLQNMPCIS